MLKCFLYHPAPVFSCFSPSARPLGLAARLLWVGGWEVRELLKMGWGGV